MTADAKQTTSSLSTSSRNFSDAADSASLDTAVNVLNPFAAPQLASQWDRVRGRLHTEVGDVEYRTWLRQMTLAGMDGDEITVHLPTRFLRDWVRSHYGDRINYVWQQENPRIRRVDIRVGEVSASPPSVARSRS